jgi:hypothetical protein
MVYQSETAKGSAGLGGVPGSFLTLLPATDVVGRCCVVDRPNQKNRFRAGKEKLVTLSTTVESQRR